MAFNTVLVSHIKGKENYTLYRTVFSFSRTIEQIVFGQGFCCCKDNFLIMYREKK